MAGARGRSRSSFTSDQGQSLRRRAAVRRFQRHERPLLRGILDNIEGLWAEAF
jgi:hypothetical protein